MLDAGQNIITRQLPKTGQTTLYGADDDGAIQGGWWRGRLNTNNRTRFIQRTVGGDDIVLDRATGLMWPKDFAGAGGNLGVTKTWNGPPGGASALFWASNLNFAGFDDWRIPNALELASLINFETGPPYIWPPFINCKWNPDGYYWTGTTYPTNTLQAMAVYFEFPYVGVRTKTNHTYVIAVRKGL